MSQQQTLGGDGLAKTYSGTELQSSLRSDDLEAVFVLLAAGVCRSEDAGRSAVVVAGFRIPSGIGRFKFEDIQDALKRYLMVHFGILCRTCGKVRRPSCQICEQNRLLRTMCDLE